MAQRTQVILEDDIDGGDADQTVTFGFQGTTYEIDLSKKNVEKFVKALEPYTTAGRKAPRRGAPSRPARPRANREDLQAIREWARSKGYEVSDRGRISQSVKDAYRAAH